MSQELHSRCIYVLFATPLAEPVRKHLVSMGTFSSPYAAFFKRLLTIPPLTEQIIASGNENDMGTSFAGQHLCVPF